MNPTITSISELCITYSPVYFRNHAQIVIRLQFQIDFNNKTIYPPNTLSMPSLYLLPASSALISSQLDHVPGHVTRLHALPCGWPPAIM